MKKLMLAMLVFTGIIALDANAGYRKCYDACDTCEPCETSCATECSSGVCRVEAEAIPPKPCCERAMVVREEPKLVEHKSYSWECPVTCKVTGYSN